MAASEAATKVVPLKKSNPPLGFPGGGPSGRHVKNSWCNGRLGPSVLEINITGSSAM